MADCDLVSEGYAIQSKAVCAIDTPVNLLVPESWPVNLVGIINHVALPEVALRQERNAGSSVLGALPFNTIVQVLRGYRDKWCYVSTRDGLMGYVQSDYVWTHLPEPTARLHKVESGVKGTAIAIAERYYAQEAYDWGRDLRYYVNVLAYANKRQIGEVKDWEKVQFQAGNLIWVPGRTYADSLTGVVPSGSLSHAIWDAVGGAFMRFGQFILDLQTATNMAGPYLRAAILKYAEAAIVDTLQSLMYVALGAIGILAVSTAVGAAVGALGGGVGAAPGAAAGFQVGLALLDWIGLGMLAAWLVQAVADLTKAFGLFISTTWSANGNAAVLDRAAQLYADAVGKLVKALLEALLMYVSAKGIGALVGKAKGTPFGKALADAKFMKWMEENAVKYRSKWEGKLKPPEVVLRRIVREPELVDASGSPCGEFDGIDMQRQMFIENKAARGTEKVNPATGKPYNPNAVADFVLKNFIDKTSAKIRPGSKHKNPRIKVLLDGTAQSTRPKASGSPNVPSLAEIKGFRKIHFRLDGDSPALRAEVAKALAQLTADNPGWTFTAQFGVDLRIPPLPTLDGDDDRSKN